MLGGERDDLRMSLGPTQPPGAGQSLRKEAGGDKDEKFCLQTHGFALEIVVEMLTALD